MAARNVGPRNTISVRPPKGKGKGGPSIPRLRKKTDRPKTERAPLVDYRPLQHAFVIMPFERTPSLERAYQGGIRKAIDALGLACVRADKVRHTSRISERIERLIRGAYFVIADMSRERPNCYYELGFAQALHKPAILTAREGTQLHFDVRDYPCIFYDSEEDLRRELEATITEAVLTSPERDPDLDVQNGEFGRCATSRGRLMTAKVLRTYFEDDDDDIEVCDIRIDVIALPGARSLNGPVRFYVDHSYTETFFTEKVIGGYASLELEAVQSAFTVGARADGGDTKLELDLATIPGAPSTFYPLT